MEASEAPRAKALTYQLASESYALKEAKESVQAQRQGQALLEWELMQAQKVISNYPMTSSCRLGQYGLHVIVQIASTISIQRVAYSCQCCTAMVTVVVYINFKCIFGPLFLSAELLQN